MANFNSTYRPNPSIFGLEIQICYTHFSSFFFCRICQIPSFLLTVAAIPKSWHIWIANFALQILKLKIKKYFFVVVNCLISFKILTTKPSYQSFFSGLRSEMFQKNLLSCYETTKVYRPPLVTFHLLFKGYHNKWPCFLIGWTFDLVTSATSIDFLKSAP